MKTWIKKCFKMYKNNMINSMLTEVYFVNKFNILLKANLKYR